MPELDLTLAWNFATALLIGALVGIERERHKRRHEHPEIAGLRTFILVALFGALSGWVSLVLATSWVLAAGLIAITAAVLTGYVLSVRMNPEGLGLTTELAACAGNSPRTRTSKMTFPSPPVSASSSATAARVARPGNSALSLM